MSNQFTAIIERDHEWYIAYCPEIPGANGHGFDRPRRLYLSRKLAGTVLRQGREVSLAKR